MRRTLPLIVTAALAAASCAGNPDPDPATAQATDRVMGLVRTQAGIANQPDVEDPPPAEEVPDPPDTGEIPEGCRIEIETDEYGFETEVIRCDEEDEEQPDPEVAAAELDAWLDSPEARRMAFQLRNLVVLQTGCTEDGSRQLATLEELVATSPEEVRPHLEDVVNALDRSARVCNEDDDRWRRRLSRALDSLELVIDVIEEDLGD